MLYFLCFSTAILGFVSSILLGIALDNLCKSIKEESEQAINEIKQRGSR
jgi:hypothetical protein